MTLEDRVARLETTTRRWRGLALLSSALLAAALFMGADAGAPEPPPPADEIAAKRFVLVDAKGAERAYLGLHKGEARLQLSGTKGALLLADVGADDASLTVMRNKGRVLGTLQARAGSSALQLTANRGNSAKHRRSAGIRAEANGPSGFQAGVGGRYEVRGLTQPNDAYFSVHRAGKPTKLNVP